MATESSLNKKIEKQKELVRQCKEKYDKLVSELEELQKERNQIRNRELIKAMESCDRDYDEIMEFLTGAKSVKKEQPAAKKPEKAPKKVEAVSEPEEDYDEEGYDGEIPEGFDEEDPEGEE